MPDPAVSDSCEPIYIPLGSTEPIRKPRFAALYHAKQPEKVQFETSPKSNLSFFDESHHLPATSNCFLLPSTSQTTHIQHPLLGATPPSRIDISLDSDLDAQVQMWGAS